MEMNNINTYFINLIKAYMISAKGQGKKDHIFGLILFLIIKYTNDKNGRIWCINSYSLRKCGIVSANKISRT